MTLFALLPVAIVMFYNLYSIRADKEAEVQAEALRVGQLASLEMQRIISGAENVLIALSAAPVIQRHDPAGCQAYLSMVGARLPQFSGIAVADTRGTILCRQKPDGVGLSLSDRDYFKEALASRAFVVGEYSIGRVSDQAMLPLALPIKGENDEIFGVIVGALSLDWLGQRLRERDFAHKSALSISDRAGTIIARIPQAENYVGTKLMPQFMKYVTARQPGAIQAAGRDGVERMLSYYPVTSGQSGLFVSAGISTEEAYETIHQANWISLGATVASLLLSIVLAWLTSTRLIRLPLAKLIATIHNWRAGNEVARTGMSERAGEFGIVGQAMDNFLDELVAARQLAAKAEEQRQLLTYELDHRVKNLLATVQSVARQTFRDDGRPDEDAVAAFTQRLTAMSQAHGLLMRENWQSANMQDVVLAATRPFAAAEQRQFEIQGPDFPVGSRAVLSLSMALHELSTNAMKYGALKGGEGRVRVHWHVDDSAPEGPLFRFLWSEAGGPPASTPQRLGFGSRMIERVLAYELEATVETQYLETGLVCALQAPFARIRAGVQG